MWKGIPSDLLFIGITYLIVFAAIALLRWVFHILIQKNSLLLRADPTNFIFLKNSISFILFSIGTFWIFYEIPILHSLGTALFAGAGILAAIVGFASQKAFSNIIGGLFILIFKPFKVGDTIEVVNLKKGIVEEINLRHTVIRDYENRRVVIPNSHISEDTIINSTLSDEHILKHIELGISYESNLQTAKEIIISEIEKHPLNIDLRSSQEIENNVPRVLIRVTDLGDFAVTLRAYAWAKNNDLAFEMQCDVLESIKERFKENGVDIPYPHRTIVYKSEKNESQ